MANAGIYYGRPKTIHKIDFTDSSVANSTAFSADTSYVMLCAKTAGCHFVVAHLQLQLLMQDLIYQKDEVIFIQSKWWR